MKELIDRWRTEALVALEGSRRALDPKKRALLEARGMLLLACSMELEEVLGSSKLDHGPRVQVQAADGDPGTGQETQEAGALLQLSGRASEPERQPGDSQVSDLSEGSVHPGSTTSTRKESQCQTSL